jgi:competence protein ComEA
VRLPARRTDDADVIRARLRALLSEGAGWVLEDEEPEERGEHADRSRPAPPPDGASTEDGRAGGPDGSTGGRHRAPARAVRLDPGRPGAGALWVAAAVAVLLLLLWTWLDRPTSEAVPEGLADPGATAESAPSSTPVPAPSVGEVADTSTTVVVSVVGLVGRPGLVTLPGGSRVADAVEAAGGLLPEADPASVNLAAVVSDGQQVAVGVPGVAAPGGDPGAPPSIGAAGPVHLNSASVAELDALPGIGPVLAQRIVDHRGQHGPFQQVGDLQDVPGIGPAILEGLAGGVVV